MKLATRHNNVTVSGSIGGESNFSIAVNAKMFRVLSDTMYKDKIGSIIRELGCNAADAHIEAGTPDLPFEVHLPNAIEPWFSVKDNGVGLSDNDLRTLYTTYGESTKDTSNDVTGAFGLGSKTPFAYTDQFTVVSIHGGMRRTYVAVINDEGLPVINLQSEEPTDDHPGLEVVIAVNSDDFDTFASGVTKQYRFFRVKPQLVNNMRGIEFVDVFKHEKVTYTYNNMVMYNGNYGTPIDGLWVVQGGVGYPIDIELLEGISKETKEFATELHRKDAFFEVPIGTVSVTANREGISYEQATISNIVKELDKMSKGIADEILQKLLDTKTLWDRCVIFNDQMSFIRSAVNAAITSSQDPAIQGIFDGVLTQGNTSVSKILPVDPIRATGIRPVLIKKYTYTKRGSWKDAWKLNRVQVVEDTGYAYSEHTKLVPSDDEKIIIKDTNSKPVARLRELFDEENLGAVWMMEGMERSSLDMTAQEVAKILQVSVDRITMLSDIEPPVVTRHGAPAAKRPVAFKHNHVNKYLNKSDDWLRVMDWDDLDDDVIILKMDRHYIQQTDAVQKLQMQLKAGLVPQQIVAVNERTYTRIMDGKLDISYQTAEEVVAGNEARIKDKGVLATRIVSLATFIRNVESSHVTKALQCADEKGEICKEMFKLSLLKDMLKQLEVEMDGISIQVVMNTVDDVKERQVRDRAETQAQKFYSRLGDRYPMVTLINGWLDNEKGKIIRQYIETVNNA